MSVSHQFRHHSRRTTSSFARSLRLESLEDRRMLATMVVTDLGDGSLASLAGDGQLSLREAVQAINIGAPVDGIGPSSGTFGSNDRIFFSSGLFGGTPQTIALTAGQLALTQSVSLTGPAGNLLTIDAQENSRIFDIAAGNDNYTIAQVTLTGGLTAAPGEAGGAIRSLTSGQLTIRDTDLVRNATTGEGSNGGAIFGTGSVIIRDSNLIDNRTEESGSNGGGVFSSENIVLSGSSITSNRTEGPVSRGGGLNADGNITISNSTISSNLTFGADSSGGGIFAAGNVALTESTVSGNRATSSGGGVSSSGTVTVTRSTVFDNRILAISATGGGIHTTTTDVIVSGSIVANNTVLLGDSDIDLGTGNLTVSFSLISDATGLGIPQATNLLDQDPLLGPLSSGGGPTRTHTPLPGSPVIDAGDASIASPPANDQRGAPFLRIANGDGIGSARIDIGSHEVQAPANADFDRDNDVDGADFLAWQRGFGQTLAAQPADGNSDEDTDVDTQDLIVWEIQFGSTNLAESTSAAQELATVATDDRAELIDLAIALDLSAPTLAATKPNVRAATNPEKASTRAQAFASLPATASSAVAADLSDAATTENDDTRDSDWIFSEELVSTAL